MPRVERTTPTRPQPQAGRPAAPAHVGHAAKGPRALTGALTVPIAHVHPDPGQPRKDFDDDGLRELAASIGENGVLQPLIVRDSGEPDAMGNDAFIIIAGERRWRAAQQAGLTEIPVVVHSVEEDDTTIRVLQLIENLQREDLNVVDRSNALKQLKVNLGTPDGKPATWDQVAAVVGVTKRRVLQLADVAELTERVQEDLRAGNVTEKHTRSLKGLSAERQEELVAVTRKEQLTPDETTAAARAMKQDTAVDAPTAVARTRPAPAPATVGVAATVAGAGEPLNRVRASSLTIDERERYQATVYRVMRAMPWVPLEALLEFGMAENMTAKTLLRLCRETRRDKGMDGGVPPRGSSPSPRA